MNKSGMSLLNLVAQDLYDLGVRDVVLSPGSRSAPLVQAFYAHQSYTIHAILHEGSAAFVAMGLAAYTGQPVVLICTSGTARLHYAPALAEAIQQGIPLFVLCADRPKEWLGQQDGQTLPRNTTYGALVKHEATLPTIQAHRSIHTMPEAWRQIRRELTDALMVCQSMPLGPVCLHIPLAPPLYKQMPKQALDSKHALPPPSKRLNIKREATKESWHSINQLLATYPKVLLLAGQASFDQNILRRMEDLCEELRLVVLGDILGNLHGFSKLCRHGEWTLRQKPKALQADLIISFGDHILSAATKQFFRKYPPKAHLRLDVESGCVPDSLNCLTHHLPIYPIHFFLEGKHNLSPKHLARRKNYQKRWLAAEAEASNAIAQKIKQASFGSFKATAILLERMPYHLHLHLGNSMPVRYANYIGLRKEQEAIEVFANRATCGIDGSLGTALGVCHASHYVLNVILLGDLSFLYEQTALLYQPLPKNLRIVVFNDKGGGIFRLLPGAREQQNLEPHYALPHKHDLSLVAQLYDLEYQHAENEKDLYSALDTFFRPERKAQLLEINIDPKIDKETFEEHIQQL